ncbi:hypothetical protein [Sphingobacterium sp. UBA6320]|jgi:hypothetical protein|uniref:hypothetical protein n=1 Tax=Sphingobacterium sp. UBA6320 TaxID=1947510 RepID=UPI0025FE33D0|nr:hypothetical protein [Sphingobacterium sp. UBA6320]
MNRYIFVILFSIISLISNFTYCAAQETCESTIKNSLEAITKLLNTNQYAQLTPIVAQIEQSCGPTELGQRIKIINLIIAKQQSSNAIEKYIENGFDEQLIIRFRDAEREDYIYQYESNKQQYNYFPLRHPIDLLIKTRSKALLQSQSYVLSEAEVDILNLFSNNELLKNQQGAIQDTRQNNSQTIIKDHTENTIKEEQEDPIAIAEYDNKSRIGFLPYIGVYGPLGGSNTTFGPNMSLGFSIMSSLAKSFIFEGGFKVRINSNDKNFDYNYYGTTESVNADFGLFFGGALGYKIYDNTKFIVIPKLNLGIDMVDTGISEDIYTDGYYDSFGDYIYGGNSKKLYTVNTMHLGLSIAGMRQLKGKNYIGLEAGYHYTPYQWDSKLMSNIYNHYGSVELFFRF